MNLPESPHRLDLAHWLRLDARRTLGVNHLGIVALSDAAKRCDMNNRIMIAELHQKLGAPSSEEVECLRLLNAFRRLAPTERFEVIELIERLADEASL